jgi:hypothetical protein
MENYLHAIWWDNFSKTYGTRKPRMELGVYLAALWTGLGIMMFNGPQMECVWSEEAPAMPDDIFAEEQLFLMRLDIAIEEVRRIEEVGDAESLVVIYDVRRIPLKIDPNKLPDCPATDALKEASPDGLSNFHPWQLLEENCGTNEGMLRVLRLFLNRSRARDDNRITILNSDCNLFYRALKVGEVVVCSAPHCNRGVSPCGETPLHAHFVHAFMLH